MPFKHTLVLDCDGVINPYSRGWAKGEMYEERVTPGFWEWLVEVQPHFECVIHSSRFTQPGGMAMTLAWLKECYQREHGTDEKMPYLKFSATKPPAWLTIDDRCVRFDGDWSDPALSVEGIKAFKPWTQRR